MRKGDHTACALIMNPTTYITPATRLDIFAGDQRHPRSEQLRLLLGLRCGWRGLGSHVHHNKWNPDDAAVCARRLLQ